MNTNDFEAKLFDELEPCYPDTNVSEGKTSYTVAGANGSYAGVNILMSGITPGIPITVSVEGADGSTAFKLFQMIPVPVEVNTGAKLRSEYLKNDRNENVIRRAPFMVYEALEPMYNIILPQMTTAAISFKTVIEYCKKERTMCFIISLAHGGKTIKLTLNVQEFPFVIPKSGLDTHMFVNWFSFSAIANYHHVLMWSEPFYALLEKYFRAAAFTRQNMLAIPLGDCFIVENGCYSLNHERLHKIVTIAKACGICYFQGGAVAGRASSQPDNDEFYNSLDHDSFTDSNEVAEAYKLKAFDDFDNGTQAVDSLMRKPIPGKGEEVIRSVAAQLYHFIKEEELQDVWYQCALDEPNDAMCETYRKISSILRFEMPSIPILEPVLPTQKVVGALDVWCPSLDVYEQNMDFFDKQVANGDKLFVYSCLTPGGNYCNRLLDFERLRIVWLGWAPAKYTNIKGFLHWGANQFSGADPFKRSAAMFSEQILEFHPKRAMFLPAGDNCIFYPGFNEPLITVRSEAHRIGYEDLCMLQALKTHDAAKANELIAKVFRGYDDFEKEVQRYRAVKLELLKATADIAN